MYNHYNKLLSLIFFTGAVVLSLELLASRILTPFFGVSLYIWTSILAVTLIFLALGYQLGGWITSKINKEYYMDLFIFIPFLSSVFILLSVLLYPYLLPKLIGINLLLGSFIGSFLLLSIPLVLLSALNPILISIIKSCNDQSSDARSGFVLFISTIGSVFGVIFTSIVLVPTLTNFSSFIINAFFLIIQTLTIYFLIGYDVFKKLKKIFLFLNLITIIALISILYFKNNYLNLITSSKDSLNNTYSIEYENSSFYGNLKVVGVRSDKNNSVSSYKLYQNGLTQNTIDKDGNSLNSYTYILDALSQLATPENALVLGLGGGIVPTKLYNRGYNVDVVDIDPSTLKIAENFFQFKKRNMNFFFADARTFSKKCPRKYNLIIIDLFFADGIPEHLTTVEFYRDLRNCLNKNGIILSNSVGDFSINETLNSVLYTFNSIFEDVYYFYDKSYIEQSTIKVANLYILATNNKDILNSEIKISDIPKSMSKKVISILKNRNKFEMTNLRDDYLIYDEKNNYSEIFSKSMTNFRKIVGLSIPSRILIN